MRKKLLPGAFSLTTESNRNAIIQQCIDSLEPFERQRRNIEIIDSWTKGKQLELEETNAHNVKIGSPFKPQRNTDDEYGDLETRAPDPWGKLIVSSLAQTVYWDGASVAEDEPTAEGAPPMDAWQVLEENNWEERQIPVTRAAIGHGLAYVKVLPAISPITGEKSATVRGVSGKRMAAFYDDLDDEWPAYAIEVDEQPADVDGNEQFAVRYYDDQAVHFLSYKGDGREKSDWTYYGPEIIHEMGVPPIVRKSNIMDLEGHAIGEIEPVIPLLRRIDQDTFDRLIVQRFGAWKVRYAAGMAKPDTDTEKRAQAMQLRVFDMLVSENPETKFGTLDGTDTKGYIEAKDSDLRVLAAITQTPPHHLLGLSANLQAEALDAAESSLKRKSLDYKIGDRGSNIQILRLIAKIRGKGEEAQARKIHIHHRNTEAQSFSQLAQALGTLATQLHVPVEMLWNRIPDWKDEDTERAKQLIESGAIDQIINALTAPPQGGAAAGADRGAQAGGAEQEPAGAVK